MGERLFSPFWYRVAELRPHLRSHVRIHRHVYRGRISYVLENPMSERQHRFGETAHYVISLLDGERTISQAWDLALDHLGDRAPTQGQMITLLSQLHSADAMLCDVPPDTSQLFERNVRHRAQQSVGKRVRNPLYVKIPFWDPDTWLERWHGVVAPLFTRVAWMLWCGVVAFAGVQALRHADDLASYTRESVWDPMSFVLLVVLYPVVKALHELGHAFAAKHYGAPVHEIGLMLLIGMPVPYVDASATAVFPDKRARMVVGAAGVLVELAIASVALLVWLEVSPGFVKLVAFQAMAIGGVSTLLFNGNPLIKFDGYYVLCDALEIANLGTRANKYLRYLVETGVLGLPERRPLDVRADERPWLATYAVLAFIYRVFLTITIALFVSTQFFSVGIALAIWSFTLQVVVPAGRGLMVLGRDPRLAEQPMATYGRGAATGAALLFALFLLPLPSWTLAEGVVWLPEQAQVRAGASGVVTRVFVESGSEVARGTPLLEINDELLVVEVRVLAAREREARARLEAKAARDRVDAEIAREELRAVRAEYARARDRLGEGTVRAPEAGRFVLPRAEDMLGRYFEKGTVIGYLDIQGAPTIRVVVPQDDVAMIRADSQSVSVRFPKSAAFEARLEREVPQATDRLPSLALGAAGGGRFAVDQSDEEGLTALESLFQFDVRLGEESAVPGIGSLAAVRFDHSSEPVGFRLLRTARRLLLGRVRV